MNLTVKTRGKKVLLKLNEEEYWVKDVKKKLMREVEGHIHISPRNYQASLCDQELVVQKRKHQEYLKLEEGRTLDDYNIRNKGILYLLDPFEWPKDYHGSWGTTTNCVNSIKSIDLSCS